MRARARQLVLTILAAAMLLAVPSVSAGTLTGTASDDHLWFVVGRDDGSWALMHHAREATDPIVQELAVLPRRPIHMAAWADRLWIVYVSEPGAEREVFAVSVRQHAVQQLWILQPHDQLELRPALPGDGRLVSVVGTNLGPVALIVPEAGSAQRVPPDGSATTAPAEREPRLLRLRGNEWIDIELPGTFPAGVWRGRLGVGGAGGGELVVIAASGRPHVPRAWFRSADGVWTGGEQTQETTLPSWLLRMGGHVAAVLRSGGDRARVDLSYVRAERYLELSSFPEPTDDWGLFGFSDGARLVTSRRPDEILIRAIDLAGGPPSEPVALSAPSLGAGAILRWPILLVLAGFGLLMIRWLKVEPAAIKLPGKLAPMPATGRVVGLAIDCLPGAVIATLVTGAPLADVLILPFITEGGGAYAVMMGVAVLHGAISEAITGSSIGKRLVGGRIIGPEGQRIGGGACLIRGVLKYLSLLIPPIALVVVLNPNLRGLHDLAARSVVVHEPERRDENA